MTRIRVFFIQVLKYQLQKAFFCAIVRYSATILMSDLEPQKQDSGPTMRQEALAFIWETVKVVVISLAIIIPVRYFLVQPFFVKGASMEHTFEDGDYILIDEIGYRFHEPARGDVLVFRYPEDQTQFFIKRIIGMPNETVEIKNDQVKIYNIDHPEGVVL